MGSGCTQQVAEREREPHPLSSRLEAKPRVVYIKVIILISMCHLHVAQLHMLFIEAEIRKEGSLQSAVSKGSWTTWPFLGSDVFLQKIHRFSGGKVSSMMHKKTGNCLWLWRWLSQ